jgi:hypothetical protein
VGASFVLNILAFVLNLVDQHVLWFYTAALLMILLNVRAYALARRERENTIFTVEKEVAAHKEGRAMSSVGAVLGIAVVITLVKFYVVPAADLSAIAQPSPTMTLFIPTREFATATPTVAPETPTATPEVVVTVAKPPTPTAQAATATPAVVAPSCPNPGVCITSPGNRARVSGRVAIRGTANIDDFQFYKIEYSIGDQPGNWNVVGDTVRQPVANGVLMELDTMTLPNGSCWVQLTVVDRTGNFPAPSRVHFTIEN